MPTVEQLRAWAANEQTPTLAAMADVVEAAKACDDHGEGRYGSRIFAASRQEADRLHDALDRLEHSDAQ